MTTSKAITLDHINSYFSLDKELQPLNLAPTATGGIGIDNLHQYPQPVRPTHSWKSETTDYVKKYLEKEKEEQVARRRIVELTEGSTFSINTIDDVEDGSTAVGGDAGGMNDLNSEATQQIYATYFNVPNRTYDSNLTISKYRDEILQQLNINPVVIVQGPTGCGKTTQVPQYILDYHQSKGTYCNIIVTQPRKIAAISIARRICQERKWQLGTIVGYQVAMDPKVSADTRLSYVTTGVFLEKLVNAKRMDMYTHVIIDEVHERNQDIDFALLLVKKFLRTNSQRVKVILMSATIDSSSFASYFAISPRMDPAPIINIAGKTKEVTEHYIHELKTLLTQIPTYEIGRPMIDPCLYDAVLKLMFVFDRIEKAEQNVPADKEYAPARGAVLIFLPGYEEISRLTSVLQAASLSKNFWIIPLHSLITVEEQTKVFRDAPVDQRKVIISTNIAESSITVPDVKYVIDFCLTKNLVTDPFTNYSCLQLEWASKANCIQRKGRAGRVDIGKVYRMVPRGFYSEFPDYCTPEIKRCPLTKTILQLKKLNLCEPQEMLAFALDPPNLSDIGHAVLQLKESLALTTTGNNELDGDLTFFGQIMANMPLDIKLSKLIIFGFIFHCLEECIIIAASLSLQSFFVRPFRKELDAYRSKFSWADYTFSDCLCYLNAYKAWKQNSVQGFFRRPGGQTEMDWAMKSFIQLKRIREVDTLVKELKSRLEKFHIVVDAHQNYGTEENFLIIKMAIAGAFFPNYFLQDRINEQDIMRQLNDNDPHSTVVVSGLPPKHGILYASALKDMFASFSQNIKIEFEESRAYVQFQRTRDTTTSTVLQAVYLALKMKKLRAPLEIAVFSPEEAERRCEQLLASKRDNQQQNQMNSNRITVKYTDPFSLQKAKIYPAPQLKEVKVFISNVNDCGHFWARLVNHESKIDFDFLQNAINANRGENLKPLSEPPEANRLYLAPYSEGGRTSYYRAQIQEVQREKVKVFFVDYGNVEIVDIKDLRAVDEKTPDVYRIPAMAYECYLSEVKPICNGMHTTWSPRANEWFKKIVNGAILYALVYSIVQDTMRVELKYKDNLGIIRNINHELISRKFAERAEESLVSKQNHEYRMLMSQSKNTEPAHSNFDLEVSWREAQEEVDSIRKTGRMHRLRGPDNPLEVSYCGLTYIDRVKPVKVEPDSVNSVSINADPQDPYVSMLVAASVSIGQNNQELIARNTTLMPKMRGLPALICLLFSPYAEIRTNKAKTAYSGALCGLGFNPNTGQSLYPDHDIEVEFDVTFSLEDISDINTTRMCFNLVLDGNEQYLQYESRSVGMIHESTRKRILKLLERIRKPREPEPYRNCYQWNQAPSEATYDTQTNLNRDCQEILPLLKPPCLVEDLRAHLSALHDRVNHVSQKHEKIDCRLCSITVNSTRELLMHLDSDSHVKKEELLVRNLYQNNR